MSSSLFRTFLEAETASGFRHFYALHRRSMDTVLSVDPAAVLPALLHDQKRPARLIAWHSVYSPSTLVGLADYDNRCAWIHPQYFSAGFPGLDPKADGVGPVHGPGCPWPSLRQELKACLMGALLARTEAEQHQPTDSGMLTAVVEEWIHQYLSPLGPSTTGDDTHFFGVPLTPEGPYSLFLDETFSSLEESVHLIACCHRDASRLLRRFGEEALLRGYSVQYFHDALEPATINHLVLPERRLGLTHAEAPHCAPPGKHARYLTLGSPLPTRAHAEWWPIVQQFYSRAWQIMESMRAFMFEEVREPARPPGTPQSLDVSVQAP
ncbi:MAG: hypothetical protein OWU84_08635 [Firmicutes bacterium]|nr:hypothetical protein [Bacillota bacterium]